MGEKDNGEVSLRNKYGKKKGAGKSASVLRTSPPSPPSFPPLQMVTRSDIGGGRG